MITVMTPLPGTVLYSQLSSELLTMTLIITP